jgi:hypothetical protein
MGEISNYGISWGWQDPSGNEDALVNLTGMNTYGQNWCELRGNEMHCGTYFPAPGSQTVSEFFAQNPRVVFASLGYTSSGTTCELATQEFITEGEGTSEDPAVVYRDGQIQTRVVVYRDGQVSLAGGEDVCQVTVGGMDLVSLTSNSFDWNGFIELHPYYRDGSALTTSETKKVMDLGQTTFNMLDGSSTEAICHFGDEFNVFCGTQTGNFYTPLEATELLQLESITVEWQAFEEQSDNSLLSCGESKSFEVPIAAAIPDDVRAALESMQETVEEAQNDAEQAAGNEDVVTATGSITSNCRTGPGTAYDNIGTLNKSQTEQIIGRTSDNTWVVINHPNNSSGYCWVANGSNINISGNLNTVQVWSAPPLPNQDEESADGDQPSSDDGSPSDEGSSGGSGETTTSISFSIRNKTGSSLCSLSISEQGQSSFVGLGGAFELDNNGTKSFTATAIEGDYYDLSAENCAEGSGGETYYVYGVQLISGTLFVFLP